MSVHKDERKNGKWLVVHKGKKYRGFDSKKEALEHECRLILGQETGTKEKTFQEVAELYLEDLKKRTAFGTYQKCFQVYHKYIKPNVVDKGIYTFTELDCKFFSDYVSTLNLSTTHKNYIQNKYIAVFKFAERYLKLKDNPTKVLESFKKTFEEKLKKREKEFNIWTPEEFQDFIQYVHVDKYRMLFYVLFFTGIRQGEAQALQWKDFKDDYLDIYKNWSPKSESKAYLIKDTKTDSSTRKVKLNPGLTQLLNDYKEEFSNIAGFNDDWYIFGNISPLPRTHICRIKDKACDENGVRRITIHEFRHSHASNLISSGTNIVAISRRLGHSDVNVTLKVYTHLLQKNEEELLGNLERSFPSLPQNLPQSNFEHQKSPLNRA